MDYYKCLFVGGKFITIILVKNQNHSCRKYIEIKYHIIKDASEKDKIKS